MSHAHDPDRMKLIDFIDSYPNDSYDSDEDDSFYALDERESLISPKWRARFTHIARRVPRRVQRHLLIYLLCFLLFLISWFTILGPRFSAFWKEYREMNGNPHNRYGLNKRPEFVDLVQVKQLDARHLPKGDAKLVVVGDVHGCKQELEKLLEKVGFQEPRDHLILTGDIVSKGPDSPGVVSLAARLNASSVRGNHEDKVLLSLASSLSPQSTSHIDATALALAKSFTPDQITYLQSLPVILDVGTIGTLQHVVVVHAGLVPDIPLTAQDPFQVMNMRTMNVATRTPSEKRDGTPWEKFWNHYQSKRKGKHDERWSVVYGHDRKRGFNAREWSYGLDSGCVGGGKLTAMVIGESGAFEFVSVDCQGYI